MAQVLRFFPRQALPPGSAGQTFYSEIFEVPNAAQITAELRAYGISGAPVGSAVSATIQDCMTPQLDSWRDVVSSAVSGSSQAQFITASNLCRFVRARVQPSVSAAMISFEGVARDAT